ncbi:MAG: AsmA family protein [Acidobacteria bacterium]|nr:MAG: AsmA family protein [Acidobacteriota bacterium]
MKRIKILFVIILLFGALAGGGALYLNHYVQTPEFKERVLERVREAVGTDVAIDELDVALLSGVTLHGLTIANPRGFEGDFFTAEEVILRHRLWPLLRRRIEIDRLVIKRPTLRLIQGSNDVWNYEKLGNRTTRRTSSSRTIAYEPTPEGMILDITLSNISASDGEVFLLSDGHPLARVEGMDVTASLDMAEGNLNGHGTVNAESINLRDALFIREATAPLSISSEKVTLDPLTGALAGGRLSGDVIFILRPSFAYAMNLQVEKARVDALLEQAHAKPVINGRLRATTTLRGTGGLPTMKGEGRIRIANGKLAEMPLQRILATLFQAPRLRQIAFDECVVVFSLANSVMRTPVVRLTSPEVRVTGQGTVSLARRTLNHRMTLALKKDLLAAIPRHMLAAFREREDGYLALDFRVWGPYDAPKTDIQRRLVTGTAKQFLEKGLKKLFGKRSPPR